MNTRLLRRIQKHILAEPKRFVMGTTHAYGAPGAPIANTTKLVGPNDFNNGNPYEQKQTFAPCGTAACIMGWGQTLGATSKDADMWNKLCSAGDWPTIFRSRYKAAKTPLARARIAVARIDHFIATKGAE